MTSRKSVLVQKRYRFEKHKYWNTSARLIREYARRITPSTVIDVGKIINGETNEVFNVKVEDGAEYIFRFAHNRKQNPFLKEKWVFKKCNDLRIPVPKILLIDSFEDGDKTVYICVESKIRGTGLGELSNTISRKKVKGILKQAGRLFRSIHSIKTKGFGDLNESGKGKHSSVGRLIRNFKTLIKKKILTALRRSPGDLTLVKKAYKILQDNRNNIYKSHSFVIHNDISPDHIIVNNGKISGVIDFESAKGADPVFEFTRWDFKFGKKYPITSFLEGYGHKRIKDFEKRFNYWKLFRLLLSLLYCINEKKTKGASYALREIKKILNFFV